MKKSFKYIPTVTVALCAFNEEQNIQTFLKSLLMQKEEGFIWENILIFSDGSTDKTVEKIKAIKSKKIRCVDGKKRLGKSQRLNQIYKSLTSDILVQFDADIILGHAHVIRNLIQPLIKEKEVGLCGGNCLPININTFMQKAIASAFFAYYPLRRLSENGNNYLSVAGQVLASSKDFIKTVRIPKNTTGNDDFIYFSCLQRGLKYRYVPSAKVFFSFPKTLSDHIKQSTRFNASSLKMKKYFPQDLLDKEYAIPGLSFIYIMIKQFIRYPILISFIIVVNTYCRIRARLKEKTLTSIWEVASSTKRLT
jgi:glycosyltransferase involved in cell wall biosynthesis